MPNFAIEITKEEDYWKKDWTREFAKCVFIVVGTYEGAELFDRFAAYKIGFELEKIGLRWMVITDKYWEEVKERYSKSPVITIGGPVANHLSFKLSQKKGLGNNAIGFELTDKLIGFIWGENAYETLKFAKTFIEGYLENYAKIAKDIIKNQ
ncbi:MAG: hypothetical protein QXT14_05850 [Candidatus Bathyarchaeia archaeon]